MASEGGGCGSGSQQAERCFLRVEAVNLSNSVYDTNDISTIRGGGFLILDAVNQLRDDRDPANAKRFHYLKHISTGASAGIFEVENGMTGDEACKKVLDAVNKAVDGHATFVASWAMADTSEKDWFNRIQETLLAQNRWKQFQQLTVPWGEGWNGASGGFDACEINGISPACLVVDKDPKKPGDKGKKISGAVDFRRKNGRTLRQKIYEIIFKNIPVEQKPDPTILYTDDLEELSKDAGMGNLDGKIAFIYMDGNKFTKIRDQKVDNDEKLTEFDKTVQDNFRNPMLAALISEMQKADQTDSTYWFHDKDAKKKEEEYKLRLETLLWGGDELEWVVPAWNGWEVLNRFYELSKSVEFHGIPLTHGAGIVFCHHTAPILEIRQMAHDLADMAKGSLGSEPPESHEKGDVFHYLVLESLDRTEADLHSFVNGYYAPVPFKDLMFNAHGMKAFTANMELLKKHFPRNKIFEIMDVLRAPGDGKKTPDEPSKEKKIIKIVNRALDGSIEKDKCISAIEEILGGTIEEKINCWFIIADLWDFVGGAQ